MQKTQETIKTLKTVQQRFQRLILGFLQKQLYLKKLNF